MKKISFLRKNLNLRHFWAIEFLSQNCIKWGPRASKLDYSDLILGAFDSFLDARVRIMRRRQLAYNAQGIRVDGNYKLAKILACFLGCLFARIRVGLPQSWEPLVLAGRCERHAACLRALVALGWRCVRRLGYKYWHHGGRADAAQLSHGADCTPLFKPIA